MSMAVIGLACALLVSQVPVPSQPPQGEPQQGQPQPGEPQEGQPQVNVAVPPAPAIPARGIASIREYRGGADGCPYVRRPEDLRGLDLSKVDFDAPVVARINGRDVTREDVRLWLAFNAGLFGIQNELTRITTQKAIQRLIAERGQDEAQAFLVTDEDVEARLRSEEDQARAQGEAGLNAYKSQVESSMGWDRYRQYVKTQLQSERLLLPPIEGLKEGEVLDPNADVTMLPAESALLLEDQPALRDFLVDAYLNRKPLAPIFRNQFLRMLQERMVERAAIVYAIEEPLPQGVYMTIEGEPVYVDQILAFAKQGRPQLERALRLLLIYRAMDDVLAAKDCVIPKEKFEANFATHEAEFANTLLPLKNLIMLKGFFNMSEYRQYYMRRLALQKLITEREFVTADSSGAMVPDKVAYEDALRAHFDRFGKLFYESGKVTVDLIFASAEELEKQLGVEDGFPQAEERILSALQAIDSKQMTFEEAKKEFSHPIATIPNGVLALKMRNELRMQLGETEYNIFIEGYSLADDVFYNRVEGETVGPVRMSNTPITGQRSGLGYLLAKVGEFRATTATKNFETQRALVENDYIDMRYTYFAHECLKDAQIELTTTGS